MNKLNKYKFRIISTKILDDLVLSANELNTLVETLELYNEFLLKQNVANTLSKLRLKFEVNKSRDIIEKFEKIITLKNDLDKLTINYNQIMLMIEASIVYQDHLKNSNGSSELEAINIIAEKEISEYLLKYLEKSINYNYEIACIECEKRKNKNKNNMMGLGESGMIQSARRKK